MNFFDYLFSESASLNKDLVIGRKEKASYRNVYKDCVTLSVYIKENYGSNNNILIIAPNSVFSIVCYLAIIKSGNVCVPLDPGMGQANFDFILDQCKSTLIFIDSGIKKKFRINEHITLIENNSYRQLIEGKIYKDKENETIDSDSLAEIIFTSGSTGKPKGVMLSHKNLIANTSSIIQYLKLQSSDIIEIVMPFFYCYGLSLLHTHIKVGGSIVLNNSFVFVGQVISDLINYRCTGFAGVPSHFQILLRKTRNFKDNVFPDLRYVTQAGGKLHSVFIKEFTDAFPEVNFFVMYGQTEATARLSYLPPTKLKDKLGSIGKGIPGVLLDVVDADGISTKANETGEIVATGDNIMLGYFNDEESTNKSIKGTRLHTGDIGYKDEDGYIYLTARIKEIIKVRGKRISPKEIEEIILAIPEIVDCTITNVDDELLGEAIKATLVVRDKNIVEDEIINEVKNYCIKQLEPFKIPSFYEVKTEFKVSSSGKKVKSLNA